MNITTKIIITDTNIITDLSHAGILKEFVALENVYISDMIRNDEINSKTGDIHLTEQFKTISASQKQLIEISQLSRFEKKLSIYDLLNYVLARDNLCILATGDNRLKQYSEQHGVCVIRTLQVIRLMYKHDIISSKKAIHACHLLKQCPTTRIPKEYIDGLICELEEGLTLTKS